MTTTIYKFEQGRLLVKESRALQSDYIGSGVPVRIGHVRAIEEVLSVDTDYSQYGLLTPLKEVRTSGHEIFVVMRRGDVGIPVMTGLATLSSAFTVALSGQEVLLSGTVPITLTGPILSGNAATGVLSGITSGLNWGGEVVSGKTMSGLITVTANVIGY